MRDIQMLYVKLEGNFSMKEKVVVDKAISLRTDAPEIEQRTTI